MAAEGPLDRVGVAAAQRVQDVAVSLDAALADLGVQAHGLDVTVLALLADDGQALDEPAQRRVPGRLLDSGRWTPASALLRPAVAE